MSQLPVRHVGNERDFGLGPNGEFFVRDQVRTLSGRPVSFPEGLAITNDVRNWGLKADGVTDNTAAPIGRRL